MSLVAALGAAVGHAEGTHGLQVGARNATLHPISRGLADAELIDPVSDQGQRARGLYFNGPMQRRLGAAGIIRSVRAASMNAVVLDFKDGEGRVGWDTQIAALQPQKRAFIKDMPGLVKQLKDAGIYTIARVVCFSDPYLPRNEPERAVMDNRPRKQGRLWADWGGRNTWLDPYNTKNHDLIVAMAKEVETVGVDEIQFDYIRFPVDEATKFATFPAEVPTPRRQVLLGMIERIDEAVHIPIGADVFGLTTFRPGDPDGLGQDLGAWASHMDVFSPMLYLNGMTNIVPKSGKSQRAQKLIYVGVKNLRERVGDGPVIRPFLQAFENGADYYNPEFIAEQIRGAREGGADGFLFWHPGSRYKMVQLGMAGPARGLYPFPMEERMTWRKQAWGVPEGLDASETRDARADAATDTAADAAADTAAEPAPAPAPAIPAQPNEQARQASPARE